MLKMNKDKIKKIIPYVITTTIRIGAFALATTIPILYSYVGPQMIRQSNEQKYEHSLESVSPDPNNCGIEKTINGKESSDKQ